MRKILVTGGAGYIGSAAVKSLVEKGHEVIVADNLSKGVRALVDDKAKFYNVDLTDKNSLENIFKENDIDAVMHFAAYKAVEESMEDAVKYSDNIKGTINLLDMMVKYGVKKIIYSSSAAIYGEPRYNPIDEQHPKDPCNYYGFTKLQCENLIRWYGEVHDIDYVSLRYFNVAGDSGLGYIDPNALNIMPIIMEAATGKRDKLMIFGEDYDTRDGSCVRDYIDINDLVRAHVLALDIDGKEMINLGTSKGTTVKELIDAAIDIVGDNLKYEIGERRKGDPAKLVASNQKAKKILSWVPEKSIKDMIKSTYSAYKK